MFRQIVLDTETTGLSVKSGHRIIEIGCVELIDRQLTGTNFHCYIKPERLVDPGAKAVHGITDEFLLDKPLFIDIASDFLNFIKDAELVIHNAPFDVRFLNSELGRLNQESYVIEEKHKITDTLVLARAEFIGKKNTLDALCKRYDIDNSQRQLHGALLDAEILADVYLAMTRHQIDLTFNQKNRVHQDSLIKQQDDIDKGLVIYAIENEVFAHEEYLDKIKKH